LKQAVKHSPTNGYAWHSLGDLYMQLLKDTVRALDAYNKAFEADLAEHKGKSYSWMPIDATLSAASILLHQTRYAEALKVIERYDDGDIRNMGAYWARRTLRMYGQIYAGMGREAECLASFKAALEREER